MADNPLVDCQARQGCLTLHSCIADWRRANRRKRVDPATSLWHCWGCPVGAKRAGQPLRNIRRTCATDYWHKRCVRCHRQGRRMVRRYWCISCYNRTMEKLRDRNARGTKPIRVPPIYNYNLVLGVPDGEQPTVVQAASMLEAVLLATLDNPTTYLTRGTPFHVAY